MTSKPDLSRRSETKADTRANVKLTKENSRRIVAIVRKAPDVLSVNRVVNRIISSSLTYFENDDGWVFEKSKP